MSETTLPRVVIWQDTWLSASETFIRDQSAALTGWEPVRVGLYELPTTILTPELAPFTPTLPGKVYRRTVGMAVNRRRFDAVFNDPRVSLVHAHFGFGGVNSLPFARRARLPLLVTFHGQDVTEAPYAGTRLARRYRRALSDVFGQAAGLIAVSDFIAGRLVELGAPEAKVVVHHIGIPLTATSPAATRDGIAFVGRLVPKKGVADLLEAVALLPEPWRSTPVHIVGFGPLEAALRAQAANLALNVTFHGKLDSAGVARVLSRSLICGAPSQVAPGGDSEGLPIVNMEAAHHGLPVVGYRHGGVVEAVADGVTGLLCDERDVGSLSRNLQRLLSDPALCRQLGEAGRQRVATEFDIQLQTAKLERIYTAVTSAPGHANEPATHHVTARRGHP